MCKVMIMGGVTKDKREAALQLVKRMGEILSPGNQDGLGYAAVNSKGELFGERWLVNKQAFKYRPTKPASPKASDLIVALTGSKDVVKPSVDNSSYSSFGDVNNLNDFTAITLHTRMATSGRGIVNTHPFVIDDTSLIHNGIISNTKDFEFKVSTCDSEAILLSYLQSKVALNTDAMSEAMSRLVGYYACGVFSRDADNNRILDVFNGHNDDLWFTFINELDTWMFVSLKDRMETGLESLGFTYSEPVQIKEGNLIRFNPLTGSLISRTDFTVGKQYNYSGNSWEGYHEYNSKNHSSKSESNVRSLLSSVSNKPVEKVSKEMAEYMLNISSLEELTEQELMEYTDKLRA